MYANEITEKIEMLAELPHASCIAFNVSSAGIGAKHANYHKFTKNVKRKLRKLRGHERSNGV